MSLTPGTAQKNSAAAATVTVTISVSAGQAVVVLAAGNGGTAITISDSAGGANTYVIPAPGANSGFLCCGAYCLALASGITSLTVSSTSATQLYATVIPVTGTGIVSFGGSNFHVYSFNTVTTTDGTDTNSITVSLSDAMLFAMCAEFSSAALTQGTGYTLASTDNFASEITEYKAVSTSQAATFTDAGVGNFAIAWGLSLQNTAGPTINTQPANQRAIPGASVTFSVSATTSGGSLTYQWFENGGSIGGATSATYTVVPNFPSDITSTWFVQVTDSNGTAQSVSVDVGFVWPPAFNRKSHPVLLDAGDQDFKSELLVKNWF